MENWYTERENKTECFPDELYEKFEKTDRLSHKKRSRKRPDNVRGFANSIISSGASASSIAFITS